MKAQYFETNRPLRKKPILGVHYSFDNIDEVKSGIALIAVTDAFVNYTHLEFSITGMNLRDELDLGTTSFLLKSCVEEPNPTALDGPVTIEERIRDGNYTALGHALHWTKGHLGKVSEISIWNKFNNTDKWARRGMPERSLHESATFEEARALVTSVGRVATEWLPVIQQARNDFFIAS